MVRIVAGDIGGTKTLLQMVDIEGDGRTIVLETRYESGAYVTFDAMLRDFVSHADAKPIDSACFAVAGPVLGNQAQVTNLKWTMVADDLARDFDIRGVSLINDFYAVALGVPLLTSADLLSLNAGTRVAHAPIAILGAGTGLGEAALIFDGVKWNVVPSEGGHADFAPQDDEQAALFTHLHAKLGHVSWERVLSGQGLVAIHNFLTGVDRAYDETIPMEIAAACEAADATAQHTFEIFVDIYGAEAGNMALRLLSRGGVFLAGGVAGKNTRHFTNGKFVEAFTRKGRFESLLATIPVDIIMNARVGLMGAGEMALRVLSDSRVLSDEC